MPEPDAIYLDNHATTPLDPRVLDAMMPSLRQDFGNPASRLHVFGRRAEAAVETAREQTAELINARYSEIVFTSGATEANNLALKGVAGAHADRGRHIITTAIEHKAVLEVCRRLEGEGWRVTYLPVDSCGLVSPDAVRAALRPDTVLVSVIAASNEIGTIQPLAEVGAICREAGALFHTDAAQAVGKLPLDVKAMNIDLLSLSGHKLYAPKGIGALYVRRKLRLAAHMDGGGQEMGLRSGTLNVPGIVGLGAACAIAAAEMASEAERLAGMRDDLLRRLQALGGVTCNGHPHLRLPGNLNVSIDGVEAEALLLGLPGLAVSAGAACASGLVTPSYVLTAIGIDEARARCSLRFGLGRFNTPAEIESAAAMVAARVTELRRRPHAA